MPILNLLSSPLQVLGDLDALVVDFQLVALPGIILIVLPTEGFEFAIATSNLLLLLLLLLFGLLVLQVLANIALSKLVLDFLSGTGAGSSC
jgi:hypothetical protein